MITIKPFLFVSALAMALQIPTNPPIVPILSLDWINTAEHITLTGALLVACVVLWKSLLAERALNQANIKTVTEALAASADSNRELRQIIKDSNVAKDNLAGSIDSLKQTVERMDVRRYDNK